MNSKGAEKKCPESVVEDTEILRLNLNSQTWPCKTIQHFLTFFNQLKSVSEFSAYQSSKKLSISYYSCAASHPISRGIPLVFICPHALSPMWT